MFDMIVKTDLDRAASFVDALIAGVNARPMREVAGHAATEVVQDHFHKLSAERHRPGVDFDFWSMAADATDFDVSDDGVIITVDAIGVAQRRYGGEIKAVNSSHLWIPVHPDAVGHTPGDFIDDLFTIISPLTNKGVAIHQDWDEVYFALVKSVTQDADPSVDPDDRAILDAVTSAQLEYLTQEVLD